MNTLSIDALTAYWSTTFLAANVTIALNIFGALLLGMLVGYERSYHGRAAGMRTYGLVAMASTALTVVVGYPEFWFGGHTGVAITSQPTQVIQGIVTGVGFLGAGIIMKDGFTISGLTSAASIWASSAIGVLVGLGFYAASITLGLLSAICMMWGPKLENLLPSRQAVAVHIRYKAGYKPTIDFLRSWIHTLGFNFAEGSLSVAKQGNHIEWRFVVIDIHNMRTPSIQHIADELEQLEGIEEYQLSHARN
ncbi:MgtC/SapB family protein [Leeia oryzae]|uniref:MgtC/SapB family protein n=1 Tax=Leeia oryzae TaxID=356662 RepID=UPI000368355F|nr:MgtC/SapB family protein [Leeia oryzae]